MVNLSKCPDCYRKVKPEQVKCRCGKLLQDYQAPELKCKKCGSKDIYKYAKIEDIWLCYEHTQKQHRDFTHNMHDYLMKHPGQAREAWNYAMEFEKYKLPDSTFDRDPKHPDLNYNEADMVAEAEKQYEQPRQHRQVDYTDLKLGELETSEDLR